MITLQTIADRVGVSRATVSMVLNGRYATARIGKTTRARVVAAAERLGYRKDEVARSMVTGQTRIIGFVASHATDEYVFRVMLGAMEAAGQFSYLLKLLPCTTAPQIADLSIRHRLVGVIGRLIDSVLVAELHRALTPHRIGLVLVDSALPLRKVSRVLYDDVLGMRLVVEHLAQLGHTRLAHLTLSEYHPFVPVRRRNLMKAAAAAGLPPPSMIAVEHGSIAEEASVQAALEKLLGTKPMPTAVVCGTDYLAMTVLRVCHRRGWRVPEDLAVTGFSDISMAAYASPSLTTVRQPFEDMGRAAVELLLASLPNGVSRSLPESERRLPVSLVARESTEGVPGGLGKLITETKGGDE